MRGNVYIFVLVIMMGVVSMLTLSLLITDYGLKVSAAYSNGLNIYGMAEAGAVGAENILNAHLSASYDEIFRQTAADVFENLSEQTVEYRREAAGDNYSGEFHLKLADSGGRRGQADALFKKFFLDNASERIPAALSTEGYTYGISLTEKEGAKKLSYTVTVKPVAETVDRITSLATLDGTDIRATVSAKISLDYGEEESSRTEILRPVFRWRDAPGWTAVGASAAGEISADGPDISGTIREAAGDVLSDSSVYLPNVSWSRENPVAVITGGAVDVSEFYNDGEPVYTAIISEGYSEITLYASDEVRNLFRGVLFSQGDVILHRINTEGNILSQGSITVVNEDGASVISADPDALIKIEISEDNLRYRLYDYLLATDFKSGSEDPLSRLTVGGGALIISDAGRSPGFRLESLREVRE